jgi:hypothetical protein
MQTPIFLTKLSDESIIFIIDKNVTLLARLLHRTITEKSRQKRASIIEVAS